MRAVNLLPRDDARSRKRNYLAYGGAAGFIVATAVLAALTITNGATVSEKRAQRDGARQELALTPTAEATEPDALAPLASEQQARLTALSSALQRRVAWDRILREFALVAPGDVWVDVMSGKSPLSPTSPQTAPTPAGTEPTGFTLRGFTYSHDAVARLLSRLALVPELSNIRLKESALANLGKREVVKYEIAADIRSGAFDS
jgi:Tfp pilus assembly protein PilN